MIDCHATARQPVGKRTHIERGRAFGAPVGSMRRMQGAVRTAAPNPARVVDAVPSQRRVQRDHAAGRSLASAGSGHLGLWFGCRFCYDLDAPIRAHNVVMVFCDQKRSATIASPHIHMLRVDEPHRDGRRVFYCEPVRSSLRRSGRRLELSARR